MVENLLKNYQLILNKNKKYDTSYVLIETPVELPINADISDLIRIYSIDQFNIISEPPIIKEQYNEFKSLIENYKRNSNHNHNYYILTIKIISISQKKLNGPAITLSEVVDPDVGMSCNPNFIYSDILNIFCLYFHNWFRIIAILYYPHEAPSYSFIQDKFISCPLNEELSHNFELICNLRQDQFYLVQKSLKKYHESLLASLYELDLALILLASSIEAPAQKYAMMEEKIEDTDFGKSLDKFLENTIKENKDTVDNLYEGIKKIYMETSYTKIYAKIKSFALTFFPISYYNEKAEQMIDDLFYLRHKYLHEGVSFNFYDEHEVCRFNISQKGGKLKHFKGQIGKKHIRVARIPSYRNLLIIFDFIIVNFINYLINHSNDPADIGKYNKDDSMPRGQIVVSINKPLKPGMVTTENDYYHEIDYIDLIQFKAIIDQTLSLIKSNQNQEALDLIEKALLRPQFNLDYLNCKQLLYLKSEVLYNLGKYQECIDLFTRNDIRINKETVTYFRNQALALAKLGRFDESNQIIDELINNWQVDSLKALFLDTKREILQMKI